MSYMRRCFSCWKALICFSDFCSAGADSVFDPRAAYKCAQMCLCGRQSVMVGEERWILLLINRSYIYSLLSLSPVRNHCPPRRFSLSLSFLIKAPAVRTATLMFPVNAHTHNNNVLTRMSTHGQTTGTINTGLMPG